MDGLKLLPLPLLVLVAVACDGGGRPHRLLYGEPAVEFRPVHGSVLTQARVLSRASLGLRLERCLFRGDRASVAPDAVVVDRVGVDSESITFANRGGTGVFACDGGIDPAGKRRGSWCGSVFGERVHGRLLDPRLDVLCVDRRRRPLAYAFVDPVADAEWVGVDQGAYVELYEVLAGLPVRIATTLHVARSDARATFEVTQYDARGRELLRGPLEAEVAG